MASIAADDIEIWHGAKSVTEIQSLLMQAFTLVDEFPLNMQVSLAMAVGATEPWTKPRHAAEVLALLMTAHTHVNDAPPDRQVSLAMAVGAEEPWYIPRRPTDQLQLLMQAHNLVGSFPAEMRVTLAEVLDSTEIFRNQHPQQLTAAILPTTAMIPRQAFHPPPPWKKRKIAPRAQ